MSSNVQNTTTNPQLAPQQLPQIPPFLKTAGTVTKYVTAAALLVVSVGSFAIGIAAFPFSPQVGAVAFAFATTCFGLAGYLIWDGGSSSNSTMHSRTVTTI
jgi:hypothetical protein